MGAGGIGGVFGGRAPRAGGGGGLLLRGGGPPAGPPGRPPPAAGPRLRSVEGDFAVDAPATDAPAEVPGLIGPVDLVLFCVKLYDTETAAEALRPPLGPAPALR